MSLFLPRRRVLSALAAMPLAAATAWAQSPAYPSKPITLVVGYPPGGSTDLTARAVALELVKRLGQPVVVENIGGAGGAVGAAKVAQAAPDGYTLLLGSNNEMAITGLVNSAQRYDPLRQFTPIGMVASQPMVLVAGPKSGVKTLDEFIQVVRRNPGKFSYGSSGVGTALHLAGEMIKEASSTFVVHIPYRGVAPLTNDLLGGQLEFGVFVLSSGLPHIRSGKVVALGVTSAQRAAVAPDIPSLSEHPSLKKVDIASWFGLWGPAGMPAALTQTLQQALQQAIAAPELRRRLEDSGATMAPRDAVLADVQARDIERYRRIVEFAKMRE